jgi:thymidylate synthase
MKQYQKLLIEVLSAGSKKEPSRNGQIATYSIFGQMIKFDLSKGFPMVTTKEVNFKNIVVELLWFLKGRTDLNYLVENNCNIWNKDFYRAWEHKEVFALSELIESVKKNEYDYDFGPIYGYQWRNLPNNDQIVNLIEGLINEPNSRRHIVECWNVSDLKNMVLPPCHKGFQMNVRGKKLDCLVQIRSSDAFLGLPYNIASYALLTHIIAFYCDYEVGNLIFSLGDVHVYENHIEQVQELILRQPKELPSLKMNLDWVIKDRSKLYHVNESDYIDCFIEELEITDFTLENYNPHPPIKAPLNVGI